ncbi:MAG: hypothetical protein JNK02_13650 [Planctomycetes bacterium]|nr:hypothetical protein [Planctomycetota bacterium]
MTFATALQLLFHANPTFDLTPAQAQAWEGLLSDVPPDALYVAAIDLARTHKFKLTIADWRERALALTGEGKAFATVFAEGWAEVMRNRRIVAIQRYESRPEKRVQVTWSNDAVRLAAEAINFRGDWEGESLGTLRAQFRDALRGLQDKGAAIDGAKSALEFAPQVKALLERPMLRRVEDHR